MATPYTYSFFFLSLAVMIVMTVGVIYSYVASNRKRAERFQREFGVSKDDSEAENRVQEVLFRKTQEVEKMVEDAIKYLSSIERFEQSPYFSWLSYWIIQNDKVVEKTNELLCLKKLAERFGFSKSKE